MVLLQSCFCYASCEGYLFILYAKVPIFYITLALLTASAFFCTARVHRYSPTHPFAVLHGPTTAYLNQNKDPVMWGMLSDDTVVPIYQSTDMLKMQ